MSKRITLISFIEKNEINKVEQLIGNIKENYCQNTMKNCKLYDIN